MSTFDYYEGPFLVHDSEEEVVQLGVMVGYRMEHLTVRDIMSESIKSVSPELSIVEAAKIMLECNVHRLLVVDEKLVSILSSTDFVKVCAGQV